MEMFVRIVETGNFSAVARQLGTTQPTISKQLTALEQRLQTRLLNRSTRSISLTEAGAAYYERCRRILDEVREAEGALGKLQSALSGTLHVNASIALGQIFLTPLLLKFQRQYPELAIELSLSDRYIDLVEEGADLAVRIGRLATNWRHAGSAARGGSWWRRRPTRCARYPKRPRISCTTPACSTLTSDRQRVDTNGPDGEIRCAFMATPSQQRRRHPPGALANGRCDVVDWLIHDKVERRGGNATARVCSAAPGHQRSLSVRQASFHEGAHVHRVSAGRVQGDSCFLRAVTA